MKKVEGDREGYLALTSDPHMSMDVKYTCTHMCTDMYFSWTRAYTNISSVFLTDLQRTSCPSLPPVPSWQLHPETNPRLAQVEQERTVKYKASDTSQEPHQEWQRLCSVRTTHPSLR